MASIIIESMSRNFYKYMFDFDTLNCYRPWSQYGHLNLSEFIDIDSPPGKGRSVNKAKDMEHERR